MNDLPWVAIDLDGVLVDFVECVRAGLTEEFGPQPFTHEDVVEWNYPPLIKPECLNGKTIWPWLKANPEIWANAPAVSGALTALENLSESFALELLTSKPEWAKIAVWGWLTLHQPPVDRVTIVGNNPARKTMPKKSQFSEAPLLIDDNLDNVREWTDAGRHAIIFDAPWNQLDSYEGFAVPRVRRGNGWRHTQQLINGTWWRKGE